MNVDSRDTQTVAMAGYMCRIYERNGTVVSQGAVSDKLCGKNHKRVLPGRTSQSKPKCQPILFCVSLKILVDLSIAR